MGGGRLSVSKGGGKEGRKEGRKGGRKEKKEDVAAMGEKKDNVSNSCDEKTVWGSNGMPMLAGMMEDDLLLSKEGTTIGSDGSPPEQLLPLVVCSLPWAPFPLQLCCVSWHCLLIQRPAERKVAASCHWQSCWRTRKGTDAHDHAGNSLG